MNSKLIDKHVAFWDANNKTKSIKEQVVTSGLS